jgi:ABC-type phosphate transport system auxiliary subunit
MNQNAERKKEITAAFESLRAGREADQQYLATHLGELRDRTTKLQTTVDIKRETVDSVQAEQNRAGVRIAVVESNVTSIRESQARSEQNWVKVSEKLESLGRIEETVKNLADDMREVRAEQSKQSE